MSAPHQLCPRLIDYLVIVGSREPGTRRDIKTPELLRRYPPDDHADFHLPNDIVFFCQPEGCYTIGQRCSASARKCVNFTFTLTDKDANKVRYGICSNFYRTAERSDDTTTPTPNVGVVSGQQRTTKAKKKKLFTLTSICIVSHHPFFTTFKQINHVVQQLINACQQRVRHVLRPRQKLLGARLANQPLWTLLSGQITPNIPSASDTKTAPPNNHQFQTQNNQVLHLILHEIKQLETWILTLLSAPVPIPGHTRVELELLPPPTTAVQKNAYEAVLPRFGASAPWQPMIFALPDKTRLPLVDMPVHFPMELMGIETCLRVLSLIMLENKVVFQSRDFCALTQTIMSFVALMYPLEYMFPIIPLLPPCMAETEHLMLAPTPYLIGIPTSFFLYKKDFVLPDDVWLVDIDASRIVPPETILREERLRQNHLNNLGATHNHHHHQQQSPTPQTLSTNHSVRPSSSNDHSPRNFSPIPQQNSDNAHSSAAGSVNDLPVSAHLVREVRYALTLLAIVENESQTQQALRNYHQLSPADRQNLVAYIQHRTFGANRTSSNEQQQHAVEDDEILYNLLTTGTCNSADALDVYIRCAIVRYLLSDNLLADLTEHCRVMRLFPRPVVAFQLYSFIKSRPQRTSFVDRLAKTQAIEYFAEWVLAPTNLAFQRITTGLNEAQAVGDKPQWFQDTLDPVQFVVYEKKTTLQHALTEYASYQAVGGSQQTYAQNSNSAAMDADEGESPNEAEDETWTAGGAIGRTSSVDNDNNSVADSDDEYDLRGGNKAEGSTTTTSSSYSSINEFVSGVVRRRAQRKQTKQSNLVENSTKEDIGTHAKNDVGQERPTNRDDEDDDAVCHGNARIKPFTQKLPLCSFELDPTKLCHPPKTLRDAAGSHAVPSPSNSMTSLFSASGTGVEDRGDDDEGDYGNGKQSNNKTKQGEDDNNSLSSGDEDRPASRTENNKAKQENHLAQLNSTTSVKNTFGPQASPNNMASSIIPASNHTASVSRDSSMDSNAERRGSTRTGSISSSFSAAAQAAVAAVTAQASSSFQRTDSNELMEPGKLQNRVHDIADKSRLKASRLLYKLRESSKEFMHDLPSKVEKKVEQFEQKFDKFADAAVTARPAGTHRQNQQPPLATQQQQLPSSAQPTALQSPQSEASDVAQVPANHLAHNRPETPTVASQHKPNMFDLKSHVRKMVVDPKQQFAELRNAMDARIDHFNKEGRSQTQTLLRKAVDEASKITGHHGTGQENANHHHQESTVGSGTPTLQSAVSRPSVSVSMEGGGTVDVGMATSADQLFLRDIAETVVTGDGVSWLKMSKLKELMKDETNRWLIVQCISQRSSFGQLGNCSDGQQQRLYRDDEFIEDVLVTKEQFKGLKKLSEALIAGYEHTFNMWGLGGMGSVFGLLEIAHTHYYEKPVTAAVRQQQQNNMSAAHSTTSFSQFESNATSAGQAVNAFGGNAENRLEEMATGMKSVFRSTMRNIRSQLGSNSPTVNVRSSMALQPPDQTAKTLMLTDDDTQSPAIRFPSKSPSPNNSVDNLDVLTGAPFLAESTTISQQQSRRRSTSGHSSPATSGPDDTSPAETNSIAGATMLLDRPVTTVTSVVAETTINQQTLKSPSKGHVTQSQLAGNKPINTVLGPAFQEAPSPYWSSPASSQPGSRRSSRSSFPARQSASSLANVSTVTTMVNSCSMQPSSQIQESTNGIAINDPSHSLIRRKQLIAHHTIHSQSVESNGSEDQKTAANTSRTANNNNNGSNSRKSSISSGFRYQAGSIIPATDTVVNHQTAGSESVLSALPERVYLFELLAGGIAGNTYSSAPLGFSVLKRSKIWDQLQFWEDAFIDATAHERDLVGLGDADPNELLQRYSSLRQADRKQMENDEDKVLAIMLYNLCAFMVAMRVNKAQMRRKMQRLLGKSHLGFLYNPQINNLLDQVANLHGNDIDLKPPFSRQQRPQTYAVYLIPHADNAAATTSATTPTTTTLAADNNLSAKSTNSKSGNNSKVGAEFAIDANQLIEQSRAFQEASRCASQYAAAANVESGLNSASIMNKNLMFMEVRDDGVLLKSMNGVPVQRCPYENLINMTFSPRTRVLCLWTRSDANNNITNPAIPAATRNNNGDTQQEQQISPASVVQQPWTPAANAPTSAVANSAYRKPVLNNQTMLSKFYCRKCKELYASIKTELGHAANKAGNRGMTTGSGINAGGGRNLNDDNNKSVVPKHDPTATWTGELGGDFPVQDQQTGEGGLLKVTMSGISLLFAESKAFVELARIRKCFTQEGGVFVLEEFDSVTREISQRSFKSPMADQICYAVLCLFSYIAAGKDNSTITNSSV